MKRCFPISKRCQTELSPPLWNSDKSGLGEEPAPESCHPGDDNERRSNRPADDHGRSSAKFRSNEGGQDQRGDNKGYPGTGATVRTNSTIKMAPTIPPAERQYQCFAPRPITTTTGKMMAR